MNHILTKNIEQIIEEHNPENDTARVTWHEAQLARAVQSLDADVTEIKEQQREKAPGFWRDIDYAQRVLRDAIKEVEKRWGDEQDISDMIDCMHMAQTGLEYHLKKRKRQ